MTREEIDKFVEEVENRPYLEYKETTDEELKDVLSAKELRKIEGKGFFNKITKFFRDKRQAKAIAKVDDLIEHIENSSVLDIIPEEYIKEITSNESNSKND